MVARSFKEIFLQSLKPLPNQKLLSKNFRKRRVMLVEFFTERKWSKRRKFFERCLRFFGFSETIVESCFLSKLCFCINLFIILNVMFLVHAEIIAESSRQDKSFRPIKKECSGVLFRLHYDAVEILFLDGVLLEYHTFDFIHVDNIIHVIMKDLFFPFRFLPVRKDFKNIFFVSRCGSKNSMIFFHRF